MKIRELLDSPEKWTKGELARNLHGVAVAPTARGACQWCLVGAIFRCYPNALVVYRRVQDYLLGRSVSFWNDREETTYELVKALVDEMDI